MSPSFEEPAQAYKQAQGWKDPTPDRPIIYLVTWWDEHNVQHTQQVLCREEAADAVWTLREKGYHAGWDEIDPLNSAGDTNSGV